MPEAAPSVVLERPVTDVNIPEPQPISDSVTTPPQILDDTARKIASNLQVAAHPQISDKQVLPHAEADEALKVMAQDAGIGAQIIEAGHELNGVLKHVRESFVGGSSGVHIARKSSRGHFGTIERAFKIAKKRGRGIVVRNLLSTKGK